MKFIEKRLFDLQDVSYKQFHSKLMPTVDTDLIIGVRTPDLRALAKELAGSKDAEAFMKVLPHSYYEENNLHGFLIEFIKDYDECVAALNAFLPYVDNWATCDMMSPKCIKKHLPEFLEQIKIWISSEHTYICRFGMGMLMKYYLDAEFKREYLDLIVNVHSEEYYVNMMRAWYFATALAKQYDAVLPYMQQKKLDDWTHNKAIQKAIESRRVSPEQKAYLRALKV